MSRGMLWAAVVAAPLLLSACATVPDLGDKPRPKAAEQLASVHSFAGVAEDGAWPDAAWWSAYGDPQLDALIAEGLSDSPNLASAVARVRAAQAYAAQAGAARFPSLDLGATASETKQSYNAGTPAEFVPQGWNETGQVSVRLGFDIDLWGRNRAALAAALSQAEATRLEMEQARLTLSTAIAGAYAELARLAEERAVLNRAAEIRETSLGLVRARVADGVGTLAEQKQAEAVSSNAHAELLAADEAIAIARNRMAALLGKGPDRGREIALPAGPAAQQAVPAGLGTALIARRPDIASARARVEAAASTIKVARAEFYPSIRLDALAGYQSLGLSQLFDPGSTFGRVAPALNLPIFRGGQLRGNYRGARAVYDLAVAEYDAAVVTAYRETADAVSSRNALAGQLAAARTALDAAELGYDLVRRRYEGGLASYLDLLTAEERLLQIRRLHARLKTRGFALDIELVRALGGGFHIASEEKTHG